MAHEYIINDPVEPYYQPPTATTNTGTGDGPALDIKIPESVPLWHPISRDPLTDPPVSSITIRIDPLNEWEQNWVDLHDDHSYQPLGEKDDDDDDDEDDSDDDDENAELREEEPDPFYNGHHAKYGPLPDHDPDDPDDDWPECNGCGSGHLIECCEGKRPRRTISKYTVCVKASTNRSNNDCAGGFVTIHDLLEQVHPRLMEWRADILDARAVKRALSAEGPEIFTREEVLEWGKEEELLVSVKGLVQIAIWNRVERTKMYTRLEDRIASLEQGS